MENAFLVRPSISVWTARKIDKQATKQAKESAGASEKAGVKVYKSVIAADALDRISSIANAARMEHRKRTVPWSYDGPGAITAEGYPAYKAAMAGHEREFSQAVSAFYAIYEQEREAARDYLGNMFNPTDYPTSASLRGKFAFSIHSEPMPQAENFRIAGLAPEHIEEIKKDIVQNNAAALQNANTSAWQRVIEKVEKLKLGLEGYKPAAHGQKVEGKFHDTLIDNIRELVELIPSINVANDADLVRVGQKLLSLTAYTAQDLRDSDALRADIARQAGLILGQINEAYRNAA